MTMLTIDFYAVRVAGHKTIHEEHIVYHEADPVERASIIDRIKRAIGTNPSGNLLKYRGQEVSVTLLVDKTCLYADTMYAKHARDCRAGRSRRVYQRGRAAGNI